MNKASLSVFLLLLSITSTFSFDCTALVKQFGCSSIINCQEKSGVCQCPNGNQCAWNLGGKQTSNCPCYDLDKGWTPFEATYCVSKFSDHNCGYETSCNENGEVGSCKCPDGKSSCLWSGETNHGCPCEGNYVSVVSYRKSKFDDCKLHIDGYNCDPKGILNCVRGSGSCTCTDGSVCRWGENYEKGCPCKKAIVEREIKDQIKQEEL